MRENSIHYSLHSLRGPGLVLHDAGDAVADEAGLADADRVETEPGGSVIMRRTTKTWPGLYVESGQTLEGSFSAASKQILQPNIRWKALGEIYKFHILLET